MAFRVYVIDRSPAVHRIVEQALGPEGYEVVTCKDGLYAIDEAKQLRPDIIIADYHLEGVAFDIFCERLKKAKLLPACFLVALTDPAEYLDEDQLRSLGAKAFLQKPFQGDHLIQIIKKSRNQTLGAERAAAKTQDLHGREASRGREPARTGQMPDAELEEAMRGLFSNFLQLIKERTELTVLQQLPDLVASAVTTHLQQIVRTEVPAQVASALPREQLTKIAQDAVQQGIPEIVAQHITGMGSMIQQHLTEAVRQQLPEVLKTQSSSIENLVKKAAEEAASQYARQAAEVITPKVQREIAKEVVEQVVRQVVPDLAEAAIKKEIERLTGSK